MVSVAAVLERSVRAEETVPVVVIGLPPVEVPQPAETEVTVPDPPPAPQSEPVPLRSPEELTWRHWVDPVIDPKVGVALKVWPSVQVLAVLSSGIVAPDVPMAVVAAAVNATPLVLVQTTAP